MNSTTSLLQITFVSLISLSSCALLSIEKSLEGKTFDQYTCRDYIFRGEQEKFALRYLAQIRAEQLCASESPFDLSQIPSWQSRLFQTDLNLVPKADGQPSVVVEPKDITPEMIRQQIKAETDLRKTVKLYRDLRQKYRNLGDRKKARASSVELYKWAQARWQKSKKDREAQEVYQEASLLHARVEWNEGKDDAALKILKRGLKDLKPLKLPADFYFLEGKILEDQKKFNLALKAYTEALKNLERQTSAPTLFDRERILWIKAWMAYKGRNWKVAEKSMAELSEHLVTAKKDIGEISRALFFRARALENSGQKKQAQEQFEKIIAEDFYSFYALATFHKLGRNLPPLQTLATQQKVEFDTNLSFLTSEQRELFFDLIKFNELDYAEAIIPFITTNPDQNLQVSLVLAQKAQRFLPIFSAFARLPNEQKRTFLHHFGDLIFPRVHEEKVLEMAEKTKVSPSLIYAIMKQESGFKEKARSGAEALGLMQVIPPLAGKLSKRYEVPYASPDDLYNPLINIQLGAFELKEQLQKQNGSIAYTAAAYNAGPNALSRWLKEYRTRDIFEFIESIPFDETRSYVKIITRNKIFYERLRDRSKEIPFPQIGPNK